MTKNSMPAARSAKKPRTVITAIAQWGKEEPPLADCTFPPDELLDAPGVTLVCVPLKPPFCVNVESDAADSDALDSDADAADAAEADAAEAEEAAAADVMDATTESAKVVSIASGVLVRNGSRAHNERHVTLTNGSEQRLWDDPVV